MSILTYRMRNASYHHTFQLTLTCPSTGCLDDESNRLVLLVVSTLDCEDWAGWDAVIWPLVSDWELGTEDWAEFMKTPEHVLQCHESTSSPSRKGYQNNQEMILYWLDMEIKMVLATRLERFKTNLAYLWCYHTFYESPKSRKCNKGRYTMAHIFSKCRVFFLLGSSIPQRHIDHNPCNDRQTCHHPPTQRPGLAQRLPWWSDSWKGNWNQLRWTALRS